MAEGAGIAELMPILARLSEDPAALSALSGLMGAFGGAQKPAQSEVKPNVGAASAGSDPLSLLSGLLTASQSGGGGQNSAHDGGKDEKNTSGLSVSKIFGSREEIKNRILLLSAVRPYLSEERRQRLETVIKLLKLAELGSLGSLLGSP